jgi:AmmeMemoRadiSam system protein B
MRSGGVRVRPTAVAGRFYPGNPEALAALVDALLAEAPPPPGPSRPVALVAPHAGYRFSGRVAAKAYAHLSPWRGKLARVVVLGPAHFMPLHGMAIPTVDAFATPLGPVPIDVDARTVATGFPAVVVDDEPHAGEHAIETQLPFLIRTLGPAVSVLPVVVGNTSPHAVAALLAALRDTPGSIAVVSTDLSHDLPEARARERDAVTAAAVLDRKGEALQPADACGSHPLRGLLRHAVDRDLDVELLELATSADAGGDPRRVVGYGAFVLHDEAGTGRKGNRSTARPAAPSA